jgi:hypothetical protein
LFSGIQIKETYRKLQNVEKMHGKGGEMIEVEWSS